MPACSAEPAETILKELNRKVGFQLDIPLYQVDAFTDRVFFGNPAAVCPIPEWLSDSAMQAIGLENNLAETAFIIDRGDSFDLRWFTPSMEAELCGHATLAAAHVVFNHLRPEWTEVTFHSGKGPLIVTRHPGGKLALSFPALSVEQLEAAPDSLMNGLSVAPSAVYGGMDYLALYEDEDTLRSVVPDQAMLGELDRRAVIITSPGDKTDIAVRFFGPKQAIPEDPFTGSAHCLLVPFWADRLAKQELTSCQYSIRLGQQHSIHADCQLKGNRVFMAGDTRQYMTGMISIDDDEINAL